MEDKEITPEVQRQIERFLDPQVKIEVMLASSPAAAKKIIETLPGVSELIDAGSQAEKALLDLLLTEEILDDFQASAVVLYLLRRSPSPEVKRALAGPIAARRFTGINSQLAAEAFLAAAEIETSRDDAISTARLEAQKIQPENTQDSKY